jgi:hypothetical protein
MSCRKCYHHNISLPSTPGPSFGAARSMPNSNHWLWWGIQRQHMWGTVSVLDQARSWFLQLYLGQDTWGQEESSLNHL